MGFYAMLFSKLLKLALFRNKFSASRWKWNVTRKRADVTTFQAMCRHAS